VFYPQAQTRLFAPVSPHLGAGIFIAKPAGDVSGLWEKRFGVPKL